MTSVCGGVRVVDVEGMQMRARIGCCRISGEETPFDEDESMRELQPTHTREILMSTLRFRDVALSLHLRKCV